MAGKTMDIDELITPDTMGTAIANMFQEWDTMKQPRKMAWEEITRYIYSTDTTTTTNSKLPWKNKTTLPKLCQIHDNLYANYNAALFPKSEYIEWIASKRDDQTKEKTEILEAVGQYIFDAPENKEVLRRLVQDYIIYGNCFVGIDWQDNTLLTTTSVSSGYVGPRLVRYSPFDIVFNPIAPSFAETPKIVRAVYTIGEIKKKLEQDTIGDDMQMAKECWDYMKDLRVRVHQYSGDFSQKNAMYAIDGFTSYVQYLRSNYVEVLTFYGDFYDVLNDKFYQNHIITVVDRHKILDCRPNPSLTGRTDIHHVGWRTRQDNLWAMGPLENLVGMQYRIDHVENLKADVFDLIAAPPLGIRGLVEDFEWGPFARIYLGDDGEVKSLAPESSTLQANMEIDQLEKKMEEYAGSPKEAAGFRTPGEKTAYEVQRLENAASRIFYSKTKQFEEAISEPALNDCMELLRRKANSKIMLRLFDDENNAVKFMEISQDDLAGVGRLKPMGARNFAEKAERVQNVNQFFSSVIGQDPEIKAHFSTIQLARMFEELLDIESFEVVKPYVRLFEQQQAQSYINAGQEQVGMEAATPTGLTPDDYSNETPAGLAQGMPVA